MKLEYRDDNCTVVGICAAGESYLWIIAQHAPEIMDDGAMDELREIAREPRLASVKYMAGRNYR